MPRPAPHDRRPGVPTATWARPLSRRLPSLLARRASAVLRTGERGAATTFLVLAAPLLLLLGGLVHDGGQAINARAAAADDAEQAARSGADAVDVATLRATGQVVLDAAAASAAAATYCARRGYGGGDCSVAAGPDLVTVTTRARVPSAVLSLVGVDGFSVEASAQAGPAVGITTEGS